MSSRPHIAIVALILVVVAGWFFWREKTGSRNDGLAKGPPSANQRAVPTAALETPGVQILKDYGSPAADAPSDLRLMHRALENFCLLVKGDDPLPLGSNDEIAAALRGKNRARLAFLPSQHAVFDEHGRLVDRWGSPLFFHAVSRDRLDIRSAGPDRQMWTPDDIHQRKDGSTFTGSNLPPASGIAK